MNQRRGERPRQHNSRTEKHLVILVIYTLLVYGSLWIARPASDYLRERALMVPVILTIFTIVFMTLVYLFAAKFNRSKTLSVGLLVVVTTVAGFTILKVIETPEESIHFLEYGVLGFLAYQLFASKYKGVAPYILALLLTAALGWIDEGIQSFIPNRGYDPKDIFFNIAGGILGLLLTFLVQKLTKNQEKDKIPGLSKIVNMENIKQRGKN